MTRLSIFFSKSTLHKSEPDISHQPFICSVAFVIFQPVWIILDYLHHDQNYELWGEYSVAWIINGTTWSEFLPDMNQSKSWADSLTNV